MDTFAGQTGISHIGRNMFFATHRLCLIVHELGPKTGFQTGVVESLSTFAGEGAHSRRPLYG